MSTRREQNRARLEATLQWLGETIDDDVEGYHTEILEAPNLYDPTDTKDMARINFIRDGAVYQCDIWLNAVRIPAPETVTTCLHRIERGRFCRACDEEQ